MGISGQDRELLGFVSEQFTVRVERLGLVDGRSLRAGWSLRIGGCEAGSV